MLVLFSCRIFLDDSFTKIPFNYCSLNLDKNLASKVSLKNGLLKTEWHKKGSIMMRSTQIHVMGSRYNSHLEIDSSHLEIDSSHLEIDSSHLEMDFSHPEMDSKHV